MLYSRLLIYTRATGPRYVQLSWKVLNYDVLSLRCRGFPTFAQSIFNFSHSFVCHKGMFFLHFLA